MNSIKFNNEKVLLVSSRFNEKYAEALRNANLNVTIFDGYSESLLRLKELALSSDITIVCTSHSPHSVMDNVYLADDYSLENQKYQFIKKDSVDNLLSRINYAIENKN